MRFSPGEMEIQIGLAAVCFNAVSRQISTDTAKRVGRMND